jgi:hypothetical protein
MLTNLYGMESKDNFIFWDTRCHKFIGDAIFNPVVVDPDFAIADFGMDDRAVNATPLFPTFMDEEMVGLVLTNHNGCGDISISVGDISVMLEDFAEAIVPLIDQDVSGWHWDSEFGWDPTHCSLRYGCL